MTDKNRVRKEMIQMRNALSKEQVGAWSACICERVMNSEVFLQAERILAYYPLGNEVDVRPIVEKAWRLGKCVAFPKVFGPEMRFFCVDNFDQLEEGSFHVMEPVEDVPVDWEDALVLVPGVAFSENGGRMGFGKGYYDKYLGSHGGLTPMGISYKLQLIDDLPLEAHDVPLNYLVTEEAFISQA